MVSVLHPLPALLLLRLVLPLEQVELADQIVQLDGVDRVEGLNCINYNTPGMILAAKWIFYVYG